MTESKTTFRDLGLSEKLLRAIEKKWYEFPSEIQAGVIPLLLKGERDIIGQAQTGTGKTASFALPLLDRLDTSRQGVQAMILAPTRELAIQVAKEIQSFAASEVKIQLLYGGQNIREEIEGLKRRPHIVVGTPGRVKDHLITKRTLDLSNISYFILDEADEMLNIGFREEIEEILTHTPEKKKTLLFSATMPRDILAIVKKYMKDYDTVKIESKTTISDRIDQKYYEVSPRNKFEALCRVVDITEDFYGIVFCKTKMDVDEVASKLVARGIKSEGIHGDIEQKHREKILGRFKEKKVHILVATDVAARGIDIDNLTHVINYSLPDSPETYTHRIGRTARAGRTGVAMSFIARSDRRKLFAVERVIGQKIPQAQIPDAQEVVAVHKKRLLENLSKIISTVDAKEFSEISEQLLALGEPKVVVAALLKDAYNDMLSEKKYNEIDEKPVAQEVGEKRLFIAKGKADDMAPGKLIRFIENDTGIHLGDVGKIDIFEKFSYLNVSSEIAFVILDYYKVKNRRKPLVVEAKTRSGSSSSSSSAPRGNKRFGYRKK